MTAQDRVSFCLSFYLGSLLLCVTFRLLRLILWATLEFYIEYLGTFVKYYELSFPYPFFLF